MGWSSWHPFSFRDEQQQLQGLDIELLEAIFNRADFEARYIEMPWARTLRELEFGSLQMTMTANKTVQREQFARFSIPYRHESTVLIIRRQDKARWQGSTSYPSCCPSPNSP